MADRSFLSWPFFEEPHRKLASELENWCERELDQSDTAHADVDARCRALARQFGDAGWLEQLHAAQGRRLARRVSVETKDDLLGQAGELT